MAEKEIWGSTKSAGKVRLHVSVTNQGIPCEDSRVSAPKYAVFPFNATQVAKARFGIEFCLELEYPPDFENAILLTVRAWTNFGGVGARWRRGCGALYCEETAPANSGAVAAWWQDLQDSVGNFQGEPHWTLLGERLLLKATNDRNNRATNAAFDAWKAAISPLSDFRQKEGLGRNCGGMREIRVGPKAGQQAYSPGRSRWPEAESLKMRTGAVAPTHANPLTLQDLNAHPAFPRATFGLPIVMKFLPDPEERPNSGSLLPKGAERMASPVILRPWLLADGSWYALAHQLSAPLPAEIEYSFVPQAEGGYAPDSHTNQQQRFRWDIPGGVNALRGSRLASYRNSPMGNDSQGNRRSESGDALEAFMAYLRSLHFREPAAIGG